MKDDSAQAISDISDNVLIFIPQLYKKLMRGEHRGEGKRASYHEPPILCMLIERGPLPISEIGRRLYISKPNMTPIIDKLIRDGRVMRMPDQDDRRVTNIGITENGRIYMRDHGREVKETIKANLSTLGKKDLDMLCESLDNVRITVSKISDK
jgi:MarR family transcriptional regulator, 2-MHQ and catechol-resistance regulon repressor